MTTPLQRAEKLLPEMSRAEKAQLANWVIGDLQSSSPGVECLPDVCGGEPCLVRTRIPVWLLERARQLGTSEAELLQCYPTLTAQDLVNAWAYVREHQTEIEAQIHANEEA